MPDSKIDFMKSRLSNLHYFFIFLLTLIGFSSCSDATDINDVVPYTRVQFEIHLVYYNDLDVPGKALYFDQNDIINSAAGYRDHGIYIVNTGDGFIAMDASCTHDVEADEHVEINEDNDALGICPLCKSEFVFLSGGSVHVGPAKYDLKKYHTYYDQNKRTLRVSN